MASAAYERLLEIQAQDLKLRQLQHRLDTHSARADVQTAAESMAAIQSQVDELDGTGHELERDQKRLSDEASTVEAKRTDLDAKLYDGSVTASKELLAMQDEIASLLDRQRSIEDDELEVMEALEELASKRAAIVADLDTAAGAKATAEQALAAATEEIEAEMSEVDRHRTELVGPVGPTLLARYEELAPQFDGVPLARFVDGRCDGCHMQLSAVAVDQLGKAPDDAAVTCEECGRLLVR